MKIDKKFIVGSRAFFKDLDTDFDYLIIKEKYPFIQRTRVYANTCEFIMKKDSKENIINHILHCDLPRKVGMMLVPEVAEYLELTVEDLKTLQSVIEKIDDNHKYEKVIYDAYIKNNSFTLTNEQREEAYAAYKEIRQTEKV